MEQEKVTSTVEEQTEMKGSGFFDSVVEPPAWLTQSYVEDILKKKENDPKLQVFKIWGASESIIVTQYSPFRLPNILPRPARNQETVSWVLFSVPISRIAHVEKSEWKG